MQDLRAINDIAQDIHPTEPNPYTLLEAVPGDCRWFTILDLKHAFFYIPTEKKAELFAFEWQNPIAKTTSQYYSTVLPQGFKNSPTIFGELLT